MNIRKIITAAAALAAVGTLAACSQADVASTNNARASDNFEVERRIVFFNGITDTNLLEIQGRCSITADVGEVGDNQLEVTCKIGDDQFKKHFLGLSDNVSYFVEQTEPNESNPYHYRVIFRPETLLPDAEIATSAGTIG